VVNLGEKNGLKKIINKMLKIPNIYVIHYSKLKDRKSKILEQFSQLHSNIKFITEYDQEQLTSDVLDNFYLPSDEDFIKKVSPLWNSNVHRPRILNIAEISCTIKHITALEEIAKNGDGFIIEDDLIIKDSFVEEFNKAIDSLPNDWDVVMIGSGCNMVSENIESDKILYKKNHPATRCLDSYLVSQSAAKKICSTIKPFQLGADWEVAYHLYLHDMNVYWLEPSPCFQGSKKGVYKSTLR